MRRNRFIIYLLLQIAVIVAVTLIFKQKQDIRISASEAGALFVLLPVVMMLWESVRVGFSRKLWFAGVLQFWLFFALPILGLRALHWETDFKDLSFLGIPGPTLHFWSSKSYLLMMLLTLGEAWRLWKNKKPA